MPLRSCKKLIFVTLFLLAGCYRQPGAGKEPPQNVLAFARQQLEAIRKRDFAGFESHIYLPVKSDNTRDILERMAAVFPAEEPKNIDLVAFVENQRISATDMAFEYGYAHKWLLVRISIVQTNGSMLVCGYFIKPMNRPVDDLVAMHWSEHGPVDYLLLGAAIFNPIFIFTVLVLCIRTPVPRRKWLWLLFIAVGWMQLTLNWHTGAWRVNPLSFQLFGSGYFAPMLYPPLVWPLFITTSVPIGAIMFLIKREKYSGARAIPEQPVTAPRNESDGETRKSDSESPG